MKTKIVVLVSFLTVCSTIFAVNKDLEKCLKDGKCTFVVTGQTWSDHGHPAKEVFLPGTDKSATLCPHCYNQFVKDKKTEWKDANSESSSSVYFCDGPLLLGKEYSSNIIDPESYNPLTKSNLSSYSSYEIMQILARDKTSYTFYLIEDQFNDIFDDYLNNSSEKSRSNLLNLILVEGKRVFNNNSNTLYQLIAFSKLKELNKENKLDDITFEKYAYWNVSNFRSLEKIYMLQWLTNIVNNELAKDKELDSLAEMIYHKLAKLLNSADAEIQRKKNGLLEEVESSLAYCSACSGNIDLVKRLLKIGFDVNAFQLRDFYTKEMTCFLEMKRAEVKKDVINVDLKYFYEDVSHFEIFKGKISKELMQNSYGLNISFYREKGYEFYRIEFNKKYMESFKKSIEEFQKEMTPSEKIYVTFNFTPEKECYCPSITTSSKH